MRHWTKGWHRLMACGGYRHQASHRLGSALPDPLAAAAAAAACRWCHTIQIVFFNSLSATATLARAQTVVTHHQIHFRDRPLIR